jgi:membrane protease YdiL (CAAX protease family)
VAAIIVAYVAIIQGLGLLSGVDDFATTGDVAGGLLLPVGASLVFVYAVVAALGWWRPVLVDDRPVQRWVWAVPAVFVVAILLAIDYGALADRGLAFTAVLLLAALCVGFAEEGMFRGITVTALRGHGWREAKVALWSSIIFGAVHVTNASPPARRPSCRRSRSASRATSST